MRGYFYALNNVHHSYLLARGIDMFDKLWQSWVEFNLREEEELEAAYHADPKGFAREWAVKAALILACGSGLGFAGVRTLANQIAVLSCDTHPMAAQSVNEWVKAECGSGLD